MILRQLTIATTGKSDGRGTDFPLRGNVRGNEKLSSTTVGEIMARKSSRKRLKVRRKRREVKPATAADLPATVPPFGRNIDLPGWNIDDQSANQIARQIAERHRRNLAATFGGQEGANFDRYVRPAPEMIHAEILRHIDAIEKIIPQLPGIGHNKPPEPVEPPPLTTDEIAEVKVYITVVNSLPAEPAELPTLLGRAWQRLKILGEEVLTQLATQAAGAAVTVAAAALWHELGDHLIAAGNLIAEWIKVLMGLS